MPNHFLFIISAMALALPPSGAQVTDGRLSQYWAQEMVGADLAREGMRQFQDLAPVRYGDFEMIFVDSLPIKNIDSDLVQEIRRNQGAAQLQFLETFRRDPHAFDNIPDLYQTMDIHGTLAMNLVFGTRVGVTKDILLSVTNSDPELRSKGVELSKRMIEKKVQLFSTSLMIQREDHVEGLNQLRKHGVVVIVPSGNDFPRSTPTVGAENYIVVGSASPTGLVSAFTSTYSAVDILAPSDYLIYSEFDGRPQKFSGTSGARPLVTGAVANVMALLPGIRQEEVESILKKTSIPLYGSSTGTEGAGLLNAYKMFRVAARLQEKWPGNRGLISGTELYSFEDEKLVMDGSNDLKVLRKAFLLNPSSPELRRDLEEAYLRQGLSLNATFYRSLRGVDLKFLAELFDDPLKEVRLSALRPSILFGAQAVPLVAAAAGRADSHEEIVMNSFALDRLNAKPIAEKNVFSYFNERVKSLGPKCVYKGGSGPEAQAYSTCLNRRTDVENEAISALRFAKLQLQSEVTHYGAFCGEFTVERKDICELETRR